MRSAYFTLVCFFFSFSVFANNITVTNTSLNGQNTTSDFTLINFDVAWENGWRTSTNENNYDGAWIFVKFRKNGTTDWRHCTISTTGNTAGTGSAFSVPTDGKGAFIYRNADGLGAVSFIGNKLQWNYGVDGILDNETVEIRVFALEMVYIPQGSFQLGSGGTETSVFTDGSATTPYLVASNASIPLGTTTGTLNPNGQGPASGSVPTAFPKGFNAFWIMKYECSQQQYADFLNHLDNARATANSNTTFSGTHPALVAPQPERAIGSVSAGRTAAIADWSGLRPLSEMEFEKASRGFNTPAVPNEYVWGNTTIVPLNSVVDGGLTTEAVSSPANSNANINNQHLSGTPVRVGVFARPTGSTRTLSGGTYYGVMNMGDNIHEIAFSIVNAQGRSIDASVHGDGFLAASGATDVASWTAFQAYGLRGGAATSPLSQGRTSDRTNVNIFTASFGGDVVGGYFGIRLVRTAP